MQSACHIHYIQTAFLLKETSKVMPPVSTQYADANLLTFYIFISVYLTHYFPLAPVRRWDKTSVALRPSTMAHPIHVTEHNCSLQEE